MQQHALLSVKHYKEAGSAAGIPRSLNDWCARAVRL